jgi:hypothetical protein
MATAVYGFFKRLEDGEDPHLVEGDMLDAFERQHADIQYRANLINRISKVLNLNVNENSWDVTIKFIARMERENGQTIEDYAKWCKEDFYNSPKAGQIANKPGLIDATWPQAFPEGKQLEMIQTEDGGFDF